MKKIKINVNKNEIQHNIFHPEDQHKPIRVQYGSGTVRYSSRVTLTGPSEVVYEPDHPLKCGARVWVETESPVILDDGKVVGGTNVSQFTCTTYTKGGTFLHVHREHMSFDDMQRLVSLGWTVYVRSGCLMPEAPAYLEHFTSRVK
jgi:hypothetical protein